MTIQQFLDEYTGLTKDRQRIGKIKFLEMLIEQCSDHEDFIISIMHEAVDIEMDDGFGTEGADI